MPSEMSLIRKACFDCRARQAAACQEQLLCSAESTHHEIAVRAGAKQLPEMPRQSIPVQPCDVLERRGSHRLITMAEKKIPRLQHGRLRDFGNPFARRSCFTRENRPDPLDRIILGKIIGFVIEVRQNIGKRTGQLGIGDNGIRHEWQGTRVTIDGADQLGRHVDHAIDQPCIRSSSPIVNLIWMQHDHISRHAKPLDTAIAKGLHTVQGQPQCVGVVPMRCKPIAVEPHLGPLNPSTFRNHAYARLKFHARTFKTQRPLQR